MGYLSYISINANKAFEQSRRDDLESLGYMLVILAKLYVPWLEIVKSNTIDFLTKFNKVLKLKLTTTPEQLCKGLPEEFTKYVQYCRGLEFEQDPDYDYLRSLFTSILMKNNQKNDYNFFWVIKSNDLKSKKENNEEYINRFKQRKNSPYIRLYNQIKKSLEKDKAQKRHLSPNKNLLLEHVNSIFLTSPDETIIHKEEIRDTKKKHTLYKKHLRNKILTNDINLKNKFKSNDKNKNQKENNKKNDTKTNNILAYNHRLIYNYDYLKSKQNQYKNVIDDNL
jgi:hypothetical protein